MSKLRQLDRSEWKLAPGQKLERFAVWGSDRYTVQGFIIPGGIIRLAINRTQRLNNDRIFDEGITWDELMEIKRQCGYGDRFAVEVYPEDEHVLNDMNMRHLWILPDRLPFAWTIDPQTGKVNKHSQA